MLDAIQYILAVEVAQFYFGDIVCLQFVDAEALHQVGDDVFFGFGLADDLYRFVYIEKDLCKAQEKMQFFVLAVALERKFS